MRLRSRPTEDTTDLLEVVHHQIPQTAAGAGAPAISPRSYADGGVTWRRMLRGLAIGDAAAMTTLLVAATYYGLSFFFPLAIAGGMFVVGAWLLPRMTRSGVIVTLVAASLTLLLFGGAFFGWTGFLYPNSWFEMVFATVTTIVPIAAITAAIATLRHRDGANAGRLPARVVAAVAALIAIVGIVGSITSSDPTRLPGDVTLSAVDFEFEQDALTASAGDVAIYFENKDVFAHNVEIKGIGKSDDAAGRVSIRHVFADLSAGSYAYLCSIHPDMKGTLTVS